jgi:1,4-dihydroxy-2-naphthoyl-CoA synthase
MRKNIETMTTEYRDDRDFDESVASEGAAVSKADGAIRDTAQKYLDRSGIKLDLRQIEKTIREKPLRSAAIAAGAGFVVGGGMVTRLGLATLALFGREAARETATNFISSGLRPNSRRLAPLRSR